MRPRALLAVAVGGLAGAAGRWAAVEILPSGKLEWGLLVANTVGCVLMGVLFGRPSIVDEIRSEVRLGATTGFCGSLTTLSGFSVVTADLISDGDTATAVAFVAISVVAGIAGAWGGAWISRVVAT